MGGGGGPVSIPATVRARPLLDQKGRWGDDGGVLTKKLRQIREGLRTQRNFVGEFGAT